jgi:YceI-like domain
MLTSIADFFDVEKFPSLHFKSSDIRIVRDRELSVEGDLTIQGVDRKVRFAVEGPTSPTEDPGAIPELESRNNEDQPQRLRLDLERGTRDRRHPRW